MLQRQASFRNRLNQKYGDSVVNKTAPIPAHLFGKEQVPVLPYRYVGNWDRLKNSKIGKCDNVFVQKSIQQDGTIAMLVFLGKNEYVYRVSQKRLQSI